MESYPWSCDDASLFYYGDLNPGHDDAAFTYWKIYETSLNPFSVSGFNGTCSFPQITNGGLADSWQHGRDLYEVYHDVLHFLPSHFDEESVSFRVTTNQITSQVAGMVTSAMYGAGKSIPLLVQVCYQFFIYFLIDLRLLTLLTAERFYRLPRTCLFLLRCRYSVLRCAKPAQLDMGCASESDPVAFQHSR